jgi:hypothetical protein
LHSPIYTPIHCSSAAVKSISSAFAAATAMLIGTSATKAPEPKPLRAGVGPKIEGGYFQSIYGNRHKRNGPLIQPRDHSTSSSSSQLAPEAKKGKVSQSATTGNIGEPDKEDNSTKTKSYRIPKLDPAPPGAAAPAAAADQLQGEAVDTTQSKHMQQQQQQRLLPHLADSGAEDHGHACSTARAESRGGRSPGRLTSSSLSYSGIASRRVTSLIHAYRDRDRTKGFASLQEFVETIKQPLGDAM